MGAVKDAVALRKNFAREGKLEKAAVVVATKAEVCLRPEDFKTGKRPNTFILLIDHEGGQIALNFKMEDLRRWKTEIQILGEAMWFKGQRLEHFEHLVR